MPATELVAQVTGKYTITQAAIEAKRAEFDALDAVTDYDGVKKAIRDCVTTRTAIEKRRKDLKAESLEFGRAVDSVARGLVGLIESIEEPLKLKRQVVDEEKARVKAEKERQEQAEKDLTVCLAQWLVDGGMVWQRRIDAVAEERRRAERDAEEARLAAERQAAAEERRKAEEAKRQAELEETKRQARIQAEREAAERAERERAEAEARRVAELERQERERARLEALKPDMEKLRDYVEAVRAVPRPEIADHDAGWMFGSACEDIDGALSSIERFCGVREAAE